MIEKIISWSTHNRFFVWIGILLIVVGGVYSVMTTPVDAIPDLSENQVIVYTEGWGETRKLWKTKSPTPWFPTCRASPM